jgi:hypothetical protein
LEQVLFVKRLTEVPWDFLKIEGWGIFVRDLPKGAAFVRGLSKFLQTGGSGWGTVFL